MVMKATEEKRPPQKAAATQAVSRRFPRSASLTGFAQAQFGQLLFGVYKVISIKCDFQKMISRL